MKKTKIISGILGTTIVVFFEFHDVRDEISCPENTGYYKRTIWAN